MTSFLDQVKWNSDGLVPVVTLESESGRLLMQAWLNREALATTVAERRAVYWSRSRQALWRKGEQSGNVQELVDIYLDCDNDSVCFVVIQHGGLACHTGRVSCYFQRLEQDSWTIAEPVRKDPESLYGKG